MNFRKFTIFNIQNYTKDFVYFSMPKSFVWVRNHVVAYPVIPYLSWSVISLKEVIWINEKGNKKKNNNKTWF